MTRLNLGTVLVCIFVAHSAALANSGTQLPLSQYQAGTEQTTLVPDGDFENGVGSAWQQAGNYLYNPAANPPVNAAALGSKSAQAIVSDEEDVNPDLLSQTFGLSAGTQYVLSGYMWDFQGAGSSAFVQLFSPDRSFNLALVLLNPAGNGGNAADGFFVHSDPFDGALFGAGSSLEVKGFKSDAGTGLVAQFDNIALTPASQFSPPQLPEPASAGLLVIGAGAALLRRSRRARSAAV